MDAKMKDIKITPIKFDKDGGIAKEEFATLSVEIPMDSASQRKAVIEMLSLLSREFIHVDVYSPRKQKEGADIKMTHTSPDGTTQTAETTQQTLEEMAD